MRIDFWSDIVCPFCALMDHRLRLALDRVAFGGQVRVAHRSFQLHPELPREGVTQEKMIEMLGMPRGSLERIVRPLEEAAKADGLTPFHPGKPLLGPTDIAHDLLAYASDQGRGHEMWGKAFRGYFGAGRTLWTLGDVVDFAVESGFDRAEVTTVLTDRRYRARVNADQHEAQRLGARGTPYLVIDGGVAIPGLLKTDELVEVISNVWASSQPAGALPVVAGNDVVCTADGCETPVSPAG